ncbi:MAG: PAS domain-containing protein [Chitinophagales bacterium]|nr:PAS domain-containing protein [Chitinophagales bacterium]
MKKGLNILMMEDSPVDAELIRRLIKKEYPDSHIEQVAVKDLFLQRLEHELPDVILADNSLPGFDAREALLLVRGRGMQIPFIMVSGTMQEDYAVQVIKEGADDYILKDRLARLPAAIETAIRQRNIEAEKASIQAKLVSSEEKYRTIMERISDGFFIVDRDWGVIYANQTAEKMFGKPVGYLQGKKMNEEFPQAIDRPFFNAYLRALETNEAVEVEEYSIVADRWMQAVMYPSENGAAIFIRDKTAQRKAEEASRKSEEKYQTMLERISDGFLVMDRNWVVKYINPAAEKLLQRPPGYLPGKKMQEEFPGALERPFFKAYDEALRTGNNKYIEEYSVSINRWFQASIYPSPDGVAVFFRDVTEQRKAEEEVRKGEEKYRNFIQRITDAFISLDNNWCYTYLNKQAGELIQRKPEELIGKNVWAEFPDAMFSATYNAFHQALKEQKYTSNVDYFAPLDLWQENHIYPSEDGISVFIRNITEKKKLEIALQERQQKEQQQMIAAALEAQEKERNAIAIELHDNVNQILVGTKIVLSMLRDNPQDPAAILKNSLDNIELAINENRRIAHELVTPDMKRESLINQLVSLCDNMLRQAGITPSIQHETYREELLSEQQQLAVYRIAQEQCTNIIKHAGATSVTFTLSMEDRDFVFSIADNGKGADPRKTNTGIGLQSIRNRISVFGGSVSIHTNPGQGFELEINMLAER